MKEMSREVVPGPDRLTEELATTLATSTWFEFKPLFLVVYSSLRQSGAAHGGEELLRLRTYYQLQTLVRHGIVEKEGKLYRGRQERLAEMVERISTRHCRELMTAVDRAE